MLVNLIDPTLLGDMYDALETEGFEQLVKATPWAEVDFCRAVMLRHKTLPPGEQMEGILLKLSDDIALRMIVQGADGPSQSVVPVAEYVANFDLFLADDILQFLEDYEFEDEEDEDEAEESEYEDEDDEEDEDEVEETHTQFNPELDQPANLFTMIAELSSLDYAIRNMAEVDQTWMEPAACEGIPEIGDLFVTCDHEDEFRIFQLRGTAPLLVSVVSPGPNQGVTLDGNEIISNEMFVSSHEGERRFTYWAFDHLVDLAQRLDAEEEEDDEDEDDDEENDVE